MSTENNSLMHANIMHHKNTSPHILLSTIMLINYLVMTAFACSNVKTVDQPILLDACCNQIENAPDPNCNILGANCAVCEYHYKVDCTFQTRCSCFWCCKYPENCPEGCDNCVYDGEGEDSCNGQNQSRNRSEVNNSIEQCGWRSPNNKQSQKNEHMIDLIMNGEATANKAQEPWLVRFEDGGTGFVVARRWVLTAAHVVAKINSSTGIVTPIENLTVTVGHNWTDSSQWHAVAEVIWHPNYTLGPPSVGVFRFEQNDIALVRIVDELNFTGDLNDSQVVRPICLMNQFDEGPISSTPDSTAGQQLNQQTARAEVVGYGLNFTIKKWPPPKPGPQVPHVGQMRFMEPVHCMQNYFGESNPTIAAQQWICLWNQHSGDAWIYIGDSGGPAIVCPVYNAGNERCAAVGTLSSTSPKVIPSSGGGPPRYARVSAYCQWMREASDGEVRCVDPLQ